MKRDFRPDELPDDWMSDRELPSAVEMERIILGTVLLDNPLFAQVVELLHRSDFFFDSHRRIFDRMLDIAARGFPIEFATLTQALRDSSELERVGGATYIASLIDGVVRTDTIAHYAEIVKEKAKARQTLRFLYDSYTQIYGNDGDLAFVIEQMRDRISEISEGLCDSLEFSGVYSSLDAFFAADLSEPEEIMRAVRRGEVTGLIAITNYGKSTLLFNASLSLSAGEVCLPLVPSASKPRRVLYLDFESPAASLRDDLQTMLRQISKPETARRGFIPIVNAHRGLEPLQLNRPGHFKQVITWAKAFKADLVIIDTAASAFEIQDENSNAEVTRRVMNPLKTLASEANCAVIFTHHIGKANETQTSEGAYRGRGASAFGALARTILTIERDVKKGEGYIVLSTPKAKGDAIEPTLLKLNRESRWFEVCEEKPEAKPQPPTVEEIASLVKSSGQMTTSDICNHFRNRSGQRTIEGRIKEAEGLGLIFKHNQKAPWRFRNGQNGHFEDLPEAIEESAVCMFPQSANLIKDCGNAETEQKENGKSQNEEPARDEEAFSEPPPGGHADRPSSNQYVWCAGCGERTELLHMLGDLCSTCAGPQEPEDNEGQWEEL